MTKKSIRNSSEKIQEKVTLETICVFQNAHLKFQRAIKCSDFRDTLKHFVYWIPEHQNTKFNVCSVVF